jgi:hypothetical protein
MNNSFAFTGSDIDISKGIVINEDSNYWSKFYQLHEFAVIG